ncbi:MAG TPA: hypothetical protein VIG47_09075, partial [Gemmatimonadaceae bacterium]
MATPAERKALLFFGLVAMLGATVRVWRAQRPAYTGSAADTYMPDSGASASARSVKSSGSRKTPARRLSTTSRTSQIIRDSNAIVDLDRATTTEIDALGVLPKG